MYVIIFQYRGCGFNVALFLPTFYNTLTIKRTLIFIAEYDKIIKVKPNQAWKQTIMSQSINKGLQSNMVSRGQGRVSVLKSHRHGDQSLIQEWRDARSLCDFSFFDAQFFWPIVLLMNLENHNDNKIKGILHITQSEKGSVWKIFTQCAMQRLERWEKIIIDLSYKNSFSLAIVA